MADRSGLVNVRPFALVAPSLSLSENERMAPSKDLRELSEDHIRFQVGVERRSLSKGVPGVMDQKNRGSLFRSESLERARKSTRSKDNMGLSFWNPENGFGFPLGFPLTPSNPRKTITLKPSARPNAGNVPTPTPPFDREVCISPLGSSFRPRTSSWRPGPQVQPNSISPGPTGFGSPYSKYPGFFAFFFE